MDSLLPSIIGAIPQLGGAGTLVVIIVLLLRREGSELARMAKLYDEELAEKDAEIDRLRIRLRELDEALDTERQRRRAAEDGGGRYWAGP